MDTSALVSLSQDPNLLARFTEYGKDRAVTLPSAALDELFAAPNADQLFSAAGLLNQLNKSFDRRLHVAQGHSEIWRAEYQEALVAIPVIPPPKREGLFGQLERAVAGFHNSADELASVRQSVKDWKSRRKASSKETAHRARTLEGLAQLSSTDLKRDLESSFGLQVVEDQAESLLRTHCDAGGEWRERWRAPDRLPAMKVQVGLMWLSMLAEALPKKFGEHDVFFEMFRPNRNDFFDAAVASVAGYCTHFVTEDAALARRCSFLRQRGFLSFESLPLNALLKDAYSVSL